MVMPNAWAAKPQRTCGGDTVFFHRAALIYIANTYIKGHNKIAWICVSDPP